MLGDTASGAPSSHSKDPYFYAETVTGAAMPEVNLSRERVNVPHGNILAKKEFSTWEEDRPPAYS